MNREESVLAHSGELVPAAPSTSPQRSFAIWFGQSTGYMANSFHLVGDGELRLEGSRMTITGKRRRPFLPNIVQEHVIDLDRVINVARSGGTVRFDLTPVADKREFIQFDASTEDALDIERQLPNAYTSDFTNRLAEIVDFHARLNRFSPRAPVTPVIVAANVVIFIAMCVAGVGIFQPDGRAVIQWGSNFGPMTMNGQWWSLLTSMFLHFGVIHLALNMWALYQNGRTIERLYGSFRFALLYVFAGLAGSMASLLWNPLVNSAGASGAIFGVFGGLLAFMIDSRSGVPASMMKEVRNSTLVFTIYSLFYGFAHAGIDNAAHIGGLVGGFLMGLLLVRPLDEASRARTDISRVVLALGSGILALGLLVWPLKNPSDSVRNDLRFQIALTVFDSQESAAVDATNKFVADARSGAIGTNAYVSTVESEVLPKWDAAYREISAAKLAAGNKQYPLQQSLMQYLDGRRKGLRMIAQAMAENDGELMKQASAAMAEADAALARVNEIAKGRKQ